VGTEASDRYIIQNGMMKAEELWCLGLLASLYLITQSHLLFKD
jgi:hypothetical protein